VWVVGLSVFFAKSTNSNAAFAHVRGVKWAIANIKRRYWRLPTVGRSGSCARYRGDKGSAVKTAEIGRDASDGRTFALELAAGSITAAAVALVRVGVVAVAVEALGNGESRGIEAPGRGVARLDVAAALFPDALGRAVGAGAPFGTVSTFALEAAVRADAVFGTAVVSGNPFWIAAGRAAPPLAISAAPCALARLGALRALAPLTASSVRIKAHSRAGGTHARFAAVDSGAACCAGDSHALEAAVDTNAVLCAARSGALVAALVSDAVHGGGGPA
jgi:hypothetical protein